MDGVTSVSTGDGAVHFARLEEGGPLCVPSRFLHRVLAALAVATDDAPNCSRFVVRFENVPTWEHGEAALATAIRCAYLELPPMDIPVPGRYHGKWEELLL